MSRKRPPVDRKRLLQELMDLCNQGIAENESPDEDLFLRNFFPIRSHYRILEPDTQVIIADKGAGKTQAFLALRFEKGRSIMTDLARANGRLAFDVTKTTWLVGYSDDSKTLPSGDVLQAFARDRSPLEMQTIWIALLIRQLLAEARVSKDGTSLAHRFPPSFSEALRRMDWNLLLLYKAVEDVRAKLISILDELDTELAHGDRYIFVTYDALDRVSPGDWDVMSIILQGLVQFWAAYSRRWRRIRPKIFLRRDMFQRAALVGPDIAKIAAHRAEILWEKAELYGMLFKRILNTGGELPTFLGNDKPRVRQDPRMGAVPDCQALEDYYPAIKRLVGEYMGADPRKGLTYTWMLNHLEDGHGNVYPRSLLRLVEQAAEEERTHRKAETESQLIHHTAVRSALDKVSEFQVLEMASEFPWLQQLKALFLRKDILVPAERKMVLGAIREVAWKAETPPSTDPDDVLNYMVDLGILRERTDSRVEVRDLYLKGLHMKRKGGAARK